MFTIFPPNSDISPSKKVKFGIDPTFPKLHLGHLVPLRHVRKMQEQGHKITIVLGTFTAQLGDPSGRDKTRPILSADIVKENANNIKAQVNKILHDGFDIFENHTLHNDIRLPEFLSIISKFTLSHITSRDSFAERIQNKQSIALHELLVPICQGLDSLHLQSEVEIGGQDQLFNFQIARELQINHGDKPQSCIMMPIINGTDGRKMSKSLNNCIFLDEDPNEIFGKVMRISDEVMKEWNPLLSNINIIDHPMENKKALAHDIVRQLHDKEKADESLAFFEKIIQSKNVPDDVQIVPISDLITIVANIRQCSKTSAKRLIEDGAVRVDGEKAVMGQQIISGQTIKIGRYFGKAE